MLFGFGLLGKFRFCGPVPVFGLRRDTSLCIRRFRLQLIQATGRIACFCSSLRLAGSAISALDAAAGSGQRRARFLGLLFRGWKARYGRVCGPHRKSFAVGHALAAKGGVEIGIGKEEIFATGWEPQQPLRSWFTQGSAAHSELMRPKRLLSPPKAASSSKFGASAAVCIASQRPPLIVKPDHTPYEGFR